jgi:hypothetical protein
MKSDAIKRSFRSAVAATAALCLLPVPAAAQVQTVVLCRKTSLSTVTLEDLVKGTYRFNGSARWQQWSATNGRWEEMCGAGRASCSVSPTTYRAEWSDSDGRWEWVMHRRDGYLSVEMTVDEEGWDAWGATAQCTPGQAPGPAF